MDERLRGLERRAVEGDLQAEAAFLRRRVAARDLPEKRLRLAAVLGHPPAHWIYERTPKVREGRFDKWVRAIRHFGGAEAMKRMQLAAGKAALPLWEAELPKEPSAREVLELGERVVRGEEAAAVARRAANALEGLCRELRPLRRRAADVNAAQRARALEAGVAIAQATLLASGTRPFRTAVDMASGLVGEGSVREAIRDALIPWALR